MKKLVLGLIIIMTFFINISRAYALSISIDDIKVLDKNNGISVNNVTNNELTIRPTITFNNVGDYVIYKITFKGTDVSKYKINGVADNNQSEYITTTYKYKETLESPLYITMTYKNKAAKDTSLDDINLKIALVGEGEEVTIPVRSQNPEERQTTSSNPQTGLLSHIMVPLVLIVVTILLLRHYTKTSEHTDLMILILCISLIPLTIYAEAKETLTISIDTGNIIIKSNSTSTPSEVKPAEESQTTQTVIKYYVYLYPNGGTGITEGQKFEYTVSADLSSFPNVTKEKCTLAGWNVGSTSGVMRTQYVDYEENGQKLYANWWCSSVNIDPSVTAGSASGYEYKSPISMSLTDLSCKVDNRTSIAVNPTIERQMKEALKRTCEYLRQNTSVYNTPNIQSAGTYHGSGAKPLYPHYYAMGIDLFNEWTFTYNGKTYRPYGSYANSSNYRNFICEVCHGDYTCKENLNYQIYEQIWKPLGFCWGGYWREIYFDPMHFEYDVGLGNCSSAPKVNLSC